MRNSFLVADDDDEGLGNRLAFTDASSFSASALVFTDAEDALVKQWFFDEDLQEEPIYLKEALAILWMLQDFPEHLTAKRLIHFCDNQAVVLTFNGQGSKIEKLQAVIKLIYLELNKLGSKLILYWINTNDQLADEASRAVNFNEEFIPMKIFTSLCTRLRVKPTIDVFATKANTKCKSYISFGLNNDPNCIAFDFFIVKPDDLVNDIMWVFPPKNLIHQTMAHLARFYSNHRYLLVFHSFGESPLGLPKLLEQGGRLVGFSKFPASIVPAEKKLIYEGQLFYGIWNDKVKATKILLMNL